MIFLIHLIFSVLTIWAQAPAAKPLMVYTSRKSHLVEPLFKAYEKKTGVKIKHINGDDGPLIQKLKQEGSSTPADLLITVDAGHLVFAAELGLLAPLTELQNLSVVPQELRDSKNLWTALSLRARTLFYNKNKVKDTDLKSYQDLADPRWKGRLCLRTSRKVYNQSLVASMIERLGFDKTLSVVQGWVKNLAKPVMTSDEILLTAIDKGYCDVGIANTYYLARMQKNGAGKNVSVFWPNAKEGGVHINISGVGLVQNSKNKKEAQRFIDWLLTQEAQELFAGLNDEYPVREKVKLSETIAKWGSFDRDQTPLTAIGKNQKKAVQLMDQALYR